MTNANDLLSSVQGQIRKAEIDNVRKELKPMVEAIVKARKLITQEEAKIVQLLQESGIPVTPENINNVFNG
jgi:hypothetical protein